MRAKGHSWPPGWETLEQSLCSVHMETRRHREGGWVSRGLDQLDAEARGQGFLGGMGVWRVSCCNRDGHLEWLSRSGATG